MIDVEFIRGQMAAIVQYAQQIEGILKRNENPSEEEAVRVLLAIQEIIRQIRRATEATHEAVLNKRIALESHDKHRVA